jgi:predicted NACHT family NTPase
MEEFKQAADGWDLERLYKDLAAAKGQFAPGTLPGLTNVEKRYLRGLLCEHSPVEIAKMLNLVPGGVNVALSNGLYRYVKQLTGKELKAIKHYTDVVVWLEKAGYRIPPPSIDRIPPPTILDLDALVEKVRQHCHDKIQMLYGKMHLLDISQPVDIDNLYVDVNILEEITSYQWRELSDLLIGFNPDADNFDRFGLSKVCQKRVSGLKAVTEHSRLMVLGKPGAGKTTFLKHIAIECNKGEFQGNQVPIFIPLKIFAEDSRGAADFGLLQYIHQEFASCGLVEQSVTEAVLSQGRGLILLDGLDEVPEKYSNKVVRQISWFARKYFNNQFIITCRIAAHNYRFKDVAFTDVEVADFNSKQIEKFAKNWFVAFARDNQDEGLALASQFIEKLNRPENQRIRELAVTPILLNLTCLVFQAIGDFPSKRSKLYEQGLDILLRRWDEAKGIERDEVYRDLDLAHKKELLSQVAAITFEQGNYFFEQKEIKRCIADYLRTLPNAITDRATLQPDSEVVLKSIEAQHGLLVERARGIYSFSHLTFQEYFTARYFVESSDSQALENLSSHITEKRWREVFLLTTEMLPNAEG